MAFAVILTILGVLTGLAGSAFFRKPGVSFWVTVPLWRAQRYLYAPGVALWWLALAILLAANIVLFKDFPRI
ncbi:hypothetical protein CO612_10070 [Lysobacteraceae bacterium NML71-0210]|nr:hypothetical protein CO612_10070 [Xanthomonadaceae bacterium NML71-0210]